MSDWIGDGVKDQPGVGGAGELMAADLDGLCNADIIIYPRAGNSASGTVFNPSYFTRAYVEPGSKSVVDNKGQRITSNLFACLSSVNMLNDGDEIEWQGRRYRVVTADCYLLSNDSSIYQIELHCVSVSR
jgi:hypothetical protein